MTSLHNCRQQADSLEAVLQTIFRTNTHLKDPTQFLTSTKYIVFHAIHNTVQHAASAMECGEFEEANVLTRTAIYRVDEFILIQISNPQVKPFPEALEKEFYAGTKINLPLRQRRGYQGSGQAISTMMEHLVHLPAGSSIRWKANGRVVQFTLKIKIP